MIFRPLLTPDQVEQYQIEDAYKILFEDFFPKLTGRSLERALE